MKKIIATILATIVAASALCMPISAAQTQPTLTILHTNDVHGYYAATGKNIGHDTIAAIADSKNALLLDAGDFSQGNYFVNQSKGTAAVEIMNAAGYDAAVLGNHEFDFGWNNMTALAKRAKFPFLTQPSVGNDPLSATVMLEKNGYKIGVFGLTTPETVRSSKGGKGVDFGNTAGIIAYANQTAEKLRSQGADIVILLSHMGTTDAGFLTSYELRDRTAGIDLIIDGHSHTALCDITQKDGKALIVSNGEYSQTVGEVDFCRIDGKWKPNAKSITKQEASAYTPKKEVTQVIAKWQGIVETAGKTVIMRSPVKLPYAREEMRTQETALGDLIADAVRTAAGTDIAFVNGGGIRADLPQGDISIETINNIVPFLNFYMAAKMTGKEILSTLEISVGSYPKQYGGFMQVSGISFKFDENAAPGSRVYDVKVQNQPLDQSKTYTVAVNDFNAGGGDGYTTFIEPFQHTLEFKGENNTLIEIISTYFSEYKGTIPTETQGRIIKAPRMIENPRTGESVEFPVVLAGCVFLAGSFIIAKQKRSKNDD